MAKIKNGREWTSAVYSDHGPWHTRYVTDSSGHHYEVCHMAMMYSEDGKAMIEDDDSLRVVEKVGPFPTLEEAMHASASQFLSDRVAEYQASLPEKAW